MLAELVTTLARVAALSLALLQARKVVAHGKPALGMPD
jgi:hypothetical protein